MIETLKTTQRRQGSSNMEATAVKMLRLSSPTMAGKGSREATRFRMGRKGVVRAAIFLGLSLCLVTIAYVQVLLVSHGRLVPTPHLQGVSSPLTQSTRRAAQASRQQSYPKDMKILLFVTTLFSRRHINQFSCCWPTLMEQSALLPNVDVMIFSNNSTKIPEVHMINTRAMFQNNPSLVFKHAPADVVKEIESQKVKANKFQMGANLGPKLGFQNGWFDDYDWVIRINPDVLIRNSTWILQQMQDPQVEGIFHDCTPRRGHQLHTDFFAVRPKAVKKHWNTADNPPFSEMALEAWSAPLESKIKSYFNHEATAYKYFAPLLEAGTARFLPDADPSKGNCRIRGASSSVYHGHESCSFARPNVCNALEGFTVT